MKLASLVIIVAARCLYPNVTLATDLEDDKKAAVEYQACLASSENVTAERIEDAVSTGMVYYGMPAAALRISLGKPLKIVQVENINGKWERWVYPNHEEQYVADGIVIMSPYVYGGSFPSKLDNAQRLLAKIPFGMTFEEVEKIFGEDWKYEWGVNRGRFRTAFYKSEKIPGYRVKIGYQYAGHDVPFGTVIELPRIEHQ